LRNGRARKFVLNAEAMEYLNQVNLSAAVRRELTPLVQDQPLDEATLRAWLAVHLPDLGAQQRKWIMDATAVAAYQMEIDFPVVELLVCDDAPNLRG
jgi:hypothetical protein